MTVITVIILVFYMVKGKYVVNKLNGKLKIIIRLGGYEHKGQTGVLSGCYGGTHN